MVAGTPTCLAAMAVACAWDRLHPRLTHRAAWLDHDGPLPVIDGTLIRLQVGLEVGEVVLLLDPGIADELRRLRAVAG